MGTRVFRGGVLVVFPLHVGLWDVGAVEFDVDLSVFFPFLLLFLEGPSVVDEVEGQQEAQHTQSEQSDVDLKGQIGELAFGISSVRPERVDVCISTQKGSPPRGPIMARNRGCCSRANTALTSDCMPVRLPNWEDGYLQRQPWLLRWSVQ